MLSNWCWRRLLRVLWTTRRSSQSTRKEINPEGLMLKLKLKLQYFGHLMQRANSLEEILMQWNIEGRRRGQQRMRWLASPSQWTWVWANPRRWRTGKAGMQTGSLWGHRVSSVDLSDWITKLRQTRSQGTKDSQLVSGRAMGGIASPLNTAVLFLLNLVFTPLE